MKLWKLCVGVKTAVLQYEFGQVSLQPFDVSGNSTFKTRLHEDGVDDRRNATEY